MLKHLMIAVSMSALLAGGAAAQGQGAPEPAQTEAVAPGTQPAPEAAPSAGTAATEAPAPQEAAGAPAGTEAAAGEKSETLVAESPADKCLMSALTLARSAEEKQISSDKLDRIEQMLAKMEDHCDAQQFNEAQATAKDIEAAINAQ